MRLRTPEMQANERHAKSGTSRVKVQAEEELAQVEIEFYVELVAFRHFHAVDEAVDDHFPGLGTGRATEPGIRQYTLLLFIARMRIFLWLFY